MPASCVAAGDDAQLFCRRSAGGARMYVASAPSDRPWGERMGAAQHARYPCSAASARYSFQIGSLAMSVVTTGRR